jgi:3-deoxy-D-manno-octulosonate 8-phosphate phosphatase (KDO 8-P phosphatase)
MNFKEKLNSVKAFVFDVDGVLTDGSLIITPEGEFLRTMNIKDGFALQLAVSKGYKVGIISGASSQAVAKRLQYLGITHIYMGITSKLDALQRYCSEVNIIPQDILFMGDDIPDYEALFEAGIAACPADASPDIKEVCDYISPYNGGKGCARDVIEQVLRLHGQWFDKQNMFVRNK